MAKFPSLFISHGSPMLAIEPSPAHDFLKTLGAQLGAPKAVIVVSAHWETSDAFRVNTGTSPATIHDFGGFSQALYQLTYPAPGDPALAEKILRILSEQAIPAQGDPHHGLDHGAWIPLLLMYPKAEIPVIQISLQTGLSPAAHFQLGKALKILRNEGILILASGGATHNLRALTAGEQPPPDWVRTFDQWVETQVAQGNWDDLLRFYEIAPFARENHPTPEHFYPLFVVLGAAEAPTGKILHHSIELGTLSMAAYAFD